MRPKSASHPVEVRLDPVDNLRLARLCGALDENLRQISAALDVTIFRRGEKFIVSGHNAERAVQILERFYKVANKIVPIEEVQLALVEQRTGLRTHAHAANEPVEDLPEIDCLQLTHKRERQEELEAVGVDVGKVVGDGGHRLNHRVL